MCLPVQMMMGPANPGVWCGEAWADGHRCVNVPGVSVCGRWDGGLGLYITAELSMESDQHDVATMSILVQQLKLTV